jgi:hypothetical protein
MEEKKINKEKKMMRWKKTTLPPQFTEMKIDRTNNG